MFQRFLRFQLGLIDFSTLKVMATIPMTNLTYLKEESEKRFKSSIKPNYVNSEALAIFNTLKFSDNLEMGYAKVEFEVDASNSP